MGDMMVIILQSSKLVPIVMVNEYALENGIEQIEIHTTSSNKVIRFMQEIKRANQRF